MTTRSPKKFWLNFRVPIFAALGFTAKLTAEQVADFFLWLYPAHVGVTSSKNGSEDLPTNGIPRNVSLVLSGLAQRGTTEALRALHRIQAERPELSELKWHVKTAEEITRRNTWIPLTPEELIQLAKNSRARLVRNGSDLLDLLVESLEGLEAKLQGITPAAEDLWNTKPAYCPKDEPVLSNYIKRHLEAELTQQGVLVNREVEIRQSLGGAPGECTDIHVDVAIPSPELGKMEKVTAIIEVKGIWNPDVSKAMGSQLVNRYLNESGVTHGLYVVGWYACSQWDSKDYRSKRSRASVGPH